MTRGGGAEITAGPPREVRPSIITHNDLPLQPCDSHKGTLLGRSEPPKSNSLRAGAGTVDP